MPLPSTTDTRDLEFPVAKHDERAGTLQSAAQRCTSGAASWHGLDESVPDSAVLRVGPDL